MMIRKSLLMLLILLMLAAFTACGLVENLQLFKGDKNATEEEQPADSGGDSTVIEDGVDTTAGIEDEQAATTETMQPSSDDMVKIVLYFASADKSTLETETREITKQEGIARATINELIAGPQNDALNPTLPASTILDGINIRDGVCTVDFSLDLIEDMPDNAQEQLLAVYSIVNTLSQFDSVETVRILVNGQEVSGGLGGIDLSTTLAPISF